MPGTVTGGFFGVEPPLEPRQSGRYVHRRRGTGEARGESVGCGLNLGAASLAAWARAQMLPLNRR